MTTIGTVRFTKEKKGWKNRIAMINPDTIRVYKAARNTLNGMQTFKSVSSPVNPVIITAKVEICSLGRSRKREIAANSSTFATMVNAPGRDFRMMFTINSPRIRSLFGSRAKINEGMPMVKVLINVNWIG